MSTSSKHRWVLGGAVALAAALLVYPVQAVTVRPARGPGLLWALPARTGAQLRMTWTHTVTLRPVTETYVIEPNGQLRLQEMTFDQFGPNLPSEPEPGTSWQVEHDRIVATGYTTRLPRLDLGLGAYGHWLRIGALEWDMIAGAGPDRLVRVGVERQPLLLIIIAEVWQWRNTNRY